MGKASSKLFSRPGYSQEPFQMEFATLPSTGSTYTDPFIFRSITVSSDERLFTESDDLEALTDCLFVNKAFSKFYLMRWVNKPRNWRSLANIRTCFELPTREADQ